MKNSWKYSLGLVLTILLILLLANTSEGLGIRIRLSGALIADSRSEHIFHGTPVRVLRVAGERRGARDVSKREAVYYALVVLPTASACTLGSRSTRDGFMRIDTWSWLARTDKNGTTEELRLEATYNASRRTIEIDSRRFVLADGNLFVIRFVDGVKPVVRQLDATIRQDVKTSVMFDIFKSLLRGDEVGQELLKSEAILRSGTGTVDIDARLCTGG